MTTKYYLDTEFDERPGSIMLISIGLACQDGREYYAVSNAFSVAACNDWVQKNVLPKLPDPSEWKHPGVIAREILDFVNAGPSSPEFWGYYADYDWVVFCWLYGRMIDLPKGWPMYCKDLKQRMDDLGYSLGDVHRMRRALPPCDEHIAIGDARWNRAIARFMNSDPETQW